MPREAQLASHEMWGGQGWHEPVQHPAPRRRSSQPSRFFTVCLFPEPECCFFPRGDAARRSFAGQRGTWVSKSAVCPQAAPLPVTPAGGGADLQQEWGAHGGRPQATLWGGGVWKE